MQRSTRQGRAIARAITESERPLSPQEVLEAAREDAPSLGMATVYRQLRVLCDEGRIRVVELPGLPPRYEKTEIPHHHHFHCDACGRVFDVDGCAHGLAGLVPRGFRAERHEITFFGRCPSCTKPAPERSRARKKATKSRKKQGRKSRGSR